MDPDVNLIFKLAYYPDRHLRKRTELVTDFTDISTIIEAMFQTMLLNNGIGLAANQCKLSHRIFVMRTPNIRRAFINPVMYICKDDGRESIPVENDETCLSFPGIVVKMPRHTQIMIQSKDEKGHDSVTLLDGLEAICAQHELDHLDGKTFVDHMGRIKQMIAERTVKKALKTPACLNQQLKRL